MRDVCLFGDCRESMRQMIAEGVKVQTCVTSPPYWGLRDYGVDGQLGLESTPDEYISSMVEVFALVRDLLADDGTLWLNLGDSYATSPAGIVKGDPFATSSLSGGRATSRAANSASRASEKCHGLKPKDLVGIPWRVAFALQADGWYLRSDIIWHKPNPMPESVTDRPTKAHEYLFLLSKRERYFYDADAIKEEISDKWTESHYKYMKNGSTQFEPKQNGYGVVGGISGTVPVDGKRNRRTVWTVATEPYSEAHFATFPTALIEPCILAGTRVGDIVFDPFMGSGTTAQVAQNLGRHWLGCELNAQYFNLQKRRAAQMGLSLA